MDDKSLFFIAIIPPEPLRMNIQELKNKFSKNFKTIHSLKSPPHVTLIPPFKLKINEEIEVISLLKKFCFSVSNFELEIMDFGAFIPRVIYLDIKENADLSKMQKKLVSQFANIKTGKHFKPHITIAARDLNLKMFRRAWSIYRYASFAGVFEVSSLYLLKHNGKSWGIFREFPFQLQKSPA